ncbi:MAG: lysine-sensitive aspartokinase 3 [Leptolyngbya sp.]|nr:lysine-sensitive aspartokinase 3 [Candidatus Melainabacteria bacterium]
MLVMKFGGTSVGSAERMQDVLSIVNNAKSQSKSAPLVVLSAMSGVTNALIRAGEKAVSKDLKGALNEVVDLRKKHADAIEAGLGKDLTKAKQIADSLEPHFEELEIILKGVSYLGELSKRSVDAVSGMGELLSSKIVAGIFDVQGIPSVWLDAREVMLTDSTFGRANPISEEIKKRAKTKITKPSKEGKVVITQGFIGSNSDGVTTTLGRGGSDYSAAIFGAAVDADEIQIWTDVDGMMTSDPRLVPEAEVIAEVGFQEAAELAYFGAKVLHPLTIKPAIEQGIAVRILNTMRPNNPGTIIKADREVQSSDGDKRPICAIAAKKGITALFISSFKMLMAHGFLLKVFEIFDRYSTSIDLIATSEVSVSLTVDRTEELDSIIRDLKDLGEVKILTDVSIVSVVGRQFRDKSGIAGEVFSALNNVNIIMISGGASDINLSFVVSNEDADKSIKQLHKHFFPVTAKV